MTDAQLSSLILKRSPIDWNQEDYEILKDSAVVGRIFLMPIGLKGRPWMWVIRDRKGRTPTHGYEATREAAMAAFAKSWRRTLPLSDKPDIEPTSPNDRV